MDNNYVVFNNSAWWDSVSVLNENLKKMNYNSGLTNLLRQQQEISKLASNYNLGFSPYILNSLKPAFNAINVFSASSVNYIQSIMNTPSMRAAIMRSSANREAYAKLLTNAKEMARNGITTYDGLLQTDLAKQIQKMADVYSSIDFRIPNLTTDIVGTANRYPQESTSKLNQLLDDKDTGSSNPLNKFVEGTSLEDYIQTNKDSNNINENIDWVAWFKKFGNQIVIAKGNSLGVNDNNGKQSESTTKFIQSSPKPIQPFLAILLRWFLYISVCIDIDTAAKWLFEVLHWLLHFLGF